MQTSVQDPIPFKELLITICLGLLVGLSTCLFINFLRIIEIQQLSLNERNWPAHVLFLPVVLFFLYLVKRSTLFFPTKISELTSWRSDSCLHWSPWMTPLHFLGSVISHMAGASVGREGVVLLMASGLVRAFQLNWSFWGPVAMGCGFSAILGNPWIGLIFVWELLSTNVRQKIYVLMSSYFAYLLMQMLQVQHLISPIDIQQDVGVLTKFGFIFALALTSGFLMRLYKWVYLRASTFFQGTTITTRILISFILVGIFLVPEFRKYQSLGLLQLENLNDLQIGFHIPLIKLTLTLFSVTLGFWGGEFIPLIYSGLHFGASLAQFMGFNQLIGTYLGCYLFFAGATRLKWTGFFLLLSLMGFSWLGWLLLLMNLTVGFSGSGSLYQSNE